MQGSRNPWGLTQLHPITYLCFRKHSFSAEWRFQQILLLNLKKYGENGSNSNFRRQVQRIVEKD
jgi:hypothetical protein